MGGTIDAEAYPEDEALHPVDATPQGSNASYEVIQSFNTAKIPLDIEHIKICDKDSKKYDDNDRAKLLGNILHLHHERDRIIITRGTDRMVETATWLKQALSDYRINCPIIFTGTIWPLNNGPSKSDGFKNLQQASQFSSRSLFPDVYVTVGNIFMFVNNVKKDFEAKKFTFIY